MSNPQEMFHCMTSSEWILIYERERIWKNKVADKSKCHSKLFFLECLTRLVLDRFIKKNFEFENWIFKNAQVGLLYRDTIILANEKVEFAIG